MMSLISLEFVKDCFQLFFEHKGSLAPKFMGEGHLVLHVATCKTKDTMVAPEIQKTSATFHCILHQGPAPAACSQEACHARSCEKMTEFVEISFLDFMQ